MSKINININDIRKGVNECDRGPHEAGFLKLDCSKLKRVFGWKPRWDIKTAVEKSIVGYKAFCGEKSIMDVTEDQIRDYLKK